jgi:hypothetical protein
MMGEFYSLSHDGKRHGLPEYVNLRIVGRASLYLHLLPFW